MRHYRFIDYATQGYMALVGGLILLFHGPSVENWRWLLLVHGLGLVLLHWLIQRHAADPRNRTLAFMRHFYPILLYVVFYRETGALNQMFVSDYLDPWFIQLEDKLFGRQPSLAFMEMLPYEAVSELFYLAYFSYYLMIGGVGLALFVKNRQQFLHYVSVISFVFYVCYTLYIFLPVMGPRVFFREIEGYRLPAEVEALARSPGYPKAVKRGPCYHLMAFIYRHFEAPGAAFPSSHVAIAIATASFSFRYLRRIRYGHAGMVVLLCLATVYCRYHYVVDVVAGVLTAAVLIPLGHYWYQRVDRPQSERP